MKIRAGLVALHWAALASAGLAAEAGLRAGAARVDITPPVAELPPPYKSVRDPLYVRALLLDNGATRAAFVVADVPMIQAGIHAELLRGISAQARVPIEHILLGATHTHNSIRVDRSASGGIIVASDAFTQRVIAATLEAVRQATANLQPARAGYAAGKSHLIANRNKWLAEQHRYIEGIDRSGTQPVDPTLGVYKFESLAGEPLAFLLNYGIEPVVNTGQKTEISGDVPGEAARYVEDHAGSRAVALFTIAPTGLPAYRVSEPVVEARETDRAHRILSAMGTLLGEEALAAAGEVRPVTQLRIAGALKTLQCPGQVTTPRNLLSECSDAPGAKVPACNYKTVDGPAVTLSYGLLRLGDVALVQADANVVPAIGDKLKRASPLANTLVALTNFGPLRYVVDDASYPLNTFDVTSTRARQGCAEQGFLDGVREMMDRLR